MHANRRTYTRTCMYTYIHTYIHTYIRRIHASMCTCIYIYINIYLSIFYSTFYLWMSVHPPVRMYSDTEVCPHQEQIAIQMLLPACRHRTVSVFVCVCVCLFLVQQLSIAYQTFTQSCIYACVRPKTRSIARPCMCMYGVFSHVHVHRQNTDAYTYTTFD